MSERPPSEEPPHPLCPKCGEALVCTKLPPSMFGAVAEGCVDCSDGAPSRQTPWACRRCGRVYLLDEACRI